MTKVKLEYYRKNWKKFSVVYEVEQYETEFFVSGYQTPNIKHQIPKTQRNNIFPVTIGSISIVPRLAIASSE